MGDQQIGCRKTASEKWQHRIVLSLLLVPLILFGCVQADHSQVSADQACAAEVPRYQIRRTDTLDTIAEVKEQYPDLTYQEIWVDEIPVLQVSPAGKETEKLPLVVFMHGVTGNKEVMAYVLALIADAGYKAVSFDLPGHGERTDGPRMFLDVLEEGTKDLDKLLDYYVMTGWADTEHLGIGGFSAGGIVTYEYGMTGKYHPEILLPVSTVADWNAMQGSGLLKLCYENSQIIDPIKSEEEVNRQLVLDNPYGNVSRLKDVTILIAHGKKDPVFSYQTAVQVEQDLIKLGNPNVSLVLYDGLGHSFSSRYFRRMLSTLKQAMPLPAD